jgi:hypothetical protein
MLVFVWGLGVLRRDSGGTPGGLQKYRHAAQGGAGEGSLGAMIIAIRFGYGKSLPEVVQPQTSPLDALDCLLAAAKSLLISW